MPASPVVFVAVALLCCGWLGTLQLAHAQNTLQCYSRDYGLERDDFPFCKVLSPELALHWSVDEGMITFGIAVAGKHKMIGLGITNSGGMRGADIAVVLKEESITAGVAWSVRDYFAVEEGALVLDDQQDWSFERTPASTAFTTVVVIQRALTTCDLLQDHEVYRDTDQMIIWALGDKLQYHGSLRGQYTLRLNPAVTPQLDLSSLANSTAQGMNYFGNSTESTYRMALMAQDPPDLQSITLGLDGRPTSVQPSHPVVYVAGQLPASSKNHIIRYEGVRAVVPDDTQDDWLLRITLIGCTGQPGALNTPYQQPHPSCTIPLALWAPGMGNYSLPPEAGLPFGTGAIQFVQVKLEYDLDEYPQGMVDASGLRLYYTAQLRPFDAGLLRLGYQEGSPVPVSQVTPVPGDSDQVLATSVASACPSECLSRLTNNLTLVASFFAMGGTGKAITTQHTRNGSEVQPLGYKGWWSSEFQGFTQVRPDSRTVMPGDALLTTCTFNTSRQALATSSSNITSLPEETCLSYLLYYPLQSGFSSCQRAGASALASCPLLPAAANASTAANATLTPSIYLSNSTQAVLAALTAGIAAGLQQAVPGTAVCEGVVAAAAAQLLAKATMPPEAALLADSGVVLNASAAAASLQTWLSQQLVSSGVLGSNASSTLSFMPGITAQALAAATNFSSLLQVLPVSAVLPADLNFTAYVLPCVAARAAYVRPPATGQAITAILLVSCAMCIVIALLWTKYARHDDEERKVLLATLQEVLLQEAAVNPDLTEAELRARLTQVATLELARRETDLKLPQ